MAPAAPGEIMVSSFPSLNIKAIETNERIRIYFTSSSPMGLSVNSDLRANTASPPLFWYIQNKELRTVLALKIVKSVEKNNILRHAQ